MSRINSLASSRDCCRHDAEGGHGLRPDGWGPVNQGRRASVQAKHGMVRTGFCELRIRRAGRNGQERPTTGDCPSELTEDCGGGIKRHLGKSDALVVLPTADNTPPRNASVPHPVRRLVASNDVALSVDGNDRDRRRSSYSRRSSWHGKQTLRARADSTAKQDDVDPVCLLQPAGRAARRGRGHHSPPSSHG